MTESVTPTRRVPSTGPLNVVARDPTSSDKLDLGMIGSEITPHALNHRPRVSRAATDKPPQRGARWRSPARSLWPGLRTASAVRPTNRRTSSQLASFNTTIPGACCGPTRRSETARSLPRPPTTARSHFQSPHWGPPRHDQSALDAGRVYVFDLSPGGIGTTREESAALQPARLAAGSNFGASVALSSPILAVGAPRADTDGTVFLYEMGDTIATWNPIGEVIPPTVPQPYTCTAGDAVALQRTLLAVGCPGQQYQEEGVYLYVGVELFSDGFESGDTSLWSASVS